MPAARDVCLRLRIRLACWVRPYLALTAAGLRMGLPIDPDVVAADLARGLRIVLDRRTAP